MTEGVGERIPEGEALRDRVVGLLRPGPLSISHVARALSEGRDHPVHRLTVAGYLAALAELGILKELDRPPAKMYQLQEPEAHRSLHQRVVRAAQAVAPGGDHAHLAAACLQHLLGRPVFTSELRHGGLGDAVLRLPRQVLADEARRTAKRALARNPATRVEVPSRDPLVGFDPGDPWLTDPRIAEVVRRVALAATHAEHLRAGEDPTRQASLRVEGSP